MVQKKVLGRQPRSRPHAPAPPRRLGGLGQAPSLRQSGAGAGLSRPVLVRLPVSFLFRAGIHVPERSLVTRIRNFTKEKVGLCF